MVNKFKKINNMDDLLSLAQEVVNLRRHAVTDGTKHTIKKLKQYLKFSIIKIKSGTKCWDWQIPKKWSFVRAEIKYKNKIIFNGDEHVMAIQPYCDSFSGKVNHKELIKHIVYSKIQPNAYAYNCKLAYRYPFEKDWLISMPFNRVKDLKKGEYDVDIKTNFSNGTMEIPEYTILGKSKKRIILLSDICHPGQADDGIIGICLWIKILQDLSKKNKLNYTYTLITPTETIGSIAWLWKNTKIIPNIKMGIFLESIGNKSKLKCKLSHKDNHEIDKLAKYIFNKNQIVKFSEGVMNDELVFADSDFDVPMISLQRFPYPEYHTSEDSVYAISKNNLNESYEAVMNIIKMIETNYVPEKKVKGPFYLSKHGLYKEANTKLDYWQNWHLMNSFNKEASIIDIANKLDIDYWEVFKSVENFRKAKLIKKNME